MPKPDTGGSRRLNDWLVTSMAVVIGALCAIIWAVVWNRITDVDIRVRVIESEKSSIVTRLETIQADIVEIKTELRRREK